MESIKKLKDLIPQKDKLTFKYLEKIENFISEQKIPVLNDAEKELGLDQVILNRLSESYDKANLSEISDGFNALIILCSASDWNFIDGIIAKLWDKIAQLMTEMENVCFIFISKFKIGKNFILLFFKIGYQFFLLYYNNFQIMFYGRK